MNRREWPLALLALATAPVPRPAAAAKRALLTLSGRIQRTNHTQADSQPDAKPGTYVFTEEEFLSLPQRDITTGTIWTPRARFTGPALADVLAHVKASGDTVQLSALNDYTTDVPWTDLARYAPILAHSRDGRRMPVAKYGPLWLMYPRDQFPSELGGRMAAARYIWQVCAIKVL